MNSWQPSKWIQLAIVGAGLPALAAGWLNTSSLMQDVSARAMAAAGTWSKVQFDGRDAKVSGEVESQDALDAAKTAVMRTYGVRSVDVSDVKIVPPVPLAPPTANSVSTNKAMPLIEGTWAEGTAKTLSVTAGAKTYSLGKDPELTSKDGKWTLQPTEAIADGSYDVTVEESDGAKRSAAAVSLGKLIVDTVAPAVPTVAAAAAGSAWPFAISGTWPEADSKEFSVKLADKTYTLGADPALKSDGSGNFTFDPKVELKPGSYNLDFTVKDSVGNVSIFTSNAAIVVSEPAKLVEVAAKPDTTPPEQPMLMPAPKDAVWPYAITGMWPEGDAKSLSIDFNKKTYELGKDKEIISDGHGAFTFLPSDQLAPGKYDLTIKVADAANNSSVRVVNDAVIIKAPAPKPAPKPVVAPVLTAPTVDTAAIDNDHAVVKGTWAAGVAKGLTVELNGAKHVLGKDFDLLTDSAGHWTLKPKAALPNGKYDVIATVTDGAGKTISDTSKGELTVNFAPPPPPAPPPPAAKPLAAPTVAVSASDSDYPVVKGPWAAGVAKGLVVDLDGVKHTLGKDFDLLSDASGKWTLKPKAPVVNGTYDVVATVSDGAGKTVSDTTKGELTVKVAAPPPPPPATQPYDCVATLARISAVFPVRFDTEVYELKSPFDSSVNQYAALLKDPRCIGLNVQVAGHADDRGRENYNQLLSENRAKAVIDALSKAGIDAKRLSGVGFSKDRPLDPSRTEDARRKNRRVEFTVLK